MSRLLNKEIKYLRGKLNEISYSTERFKVYFGEEKILMGMVSPKDEKTKLSKFMKYRTIYDTLIDLDWKIKLSFEKGIEYAYSKELQENFHIIGMVSTEEKLAYYYIENALFRTSSLWDLLAQLYCLFYDINIPNDEVYYNKLFKKNSRYYKDYKILEIEKSEEFNRKVNNISKYLSQEDNIEGEMVWKGDHKYINECRNKMTHRNSPNVNAMSDFDLNFKDSPDFMLKRIIDDYNVASKYIKEILDRIEEEYRFMSSTK